MFNLNKWSFLLILFTITLYSCGEGGMTGNEDPPQKESYNHVLTTVVPSGASSFNYYLQPVKDIANESNLNIDNSKAVELITGASAGVFQYKNSIYLNTYSPSPMMEKWDLNKDGTIVKAASMSLKELSFMGNPIFKNDELAFVAGPAQTKILIFNPTTLKKTGFIDFSKFSKLGEKSNFPQEGTDINMVMCSEMVISGKYMYAAINRINDFQKYIPATDGTDILVIDLDKVNPNSTDNSDAIVKEINSDKGAITGAWNSGMGATFMIKDEKGDVYLLCHNFWGYSSQITKKPACILRIKKGSTEFDDSYYLNVENKTLGDGNPVYNLEYAGNGNVFMAALDVSKADPNNAYSLFLDPLSQWHMVNLYNHNTTKISEEYTRGALNGNAHFENNKAYLPFSNKTENYILEYDIDMNTQKKLLTTNGTPILFKIN